MQTEIKSGGEIVFSGVSDFDIRKTFDCGQCFRWVADARGVYTGVAMGAAARIYQAEDGVHIVSTRPEPEFWKSYFDLERDYESIRLGFEGGDYLLRACEYGQGIRILCQDRWEALCSFIISQCNNIPRIMGIVDRLCRLCGEPISFEGETYYGFPSAETVAALEAEELAPLRCGYRAPYIISAARSVSSGETDLEALAAADSEAALRELKKLSGVGDKVANCVVLFGLRRLDAFPIDVWMKRALKEHFPENFTPSSLGEYAGIAQQYIFYYARSGGGE